MTRKYFLRLRPKSFEGQTMSTRKVVTNEPCIQTLRRRGCKFCLGTLVDVEVLLTKCMNVANSYRMNTCTRNTRKNTLSHHVHDCFPLVVTPCMYSTHLQHYFYLFASHQRSFFHLGIQEWPRRFRLLYSQTKVPLVMSTCSINYLYSRRKKKNCP